MKEPDEKYLLQSPRIFISYKDVCKNDYIAYSVTGVSSFYQKSFNYEK